MISDARTRFYSGNTFWPAILVCLLSVGCGTSEFPKTYPVSGTILLPDGTPVKGGYIEFESVVDTNMRALGEIGQDGTFASVYTYKSNGHEVTGLIAGEHRVRFELPSAGDNEGRETHQPKPPLIETRYRSFDTSNLTCAIPAPDNQIAIRLEKKLGPK